MQFCGIHIISDAEIKKQIAEVRESQRRQDNALVTSLLHNAEAYRKFAESTIHRPISLPDDIRGRLDEQLRENREKQKSKQ